MLTLIQPYLLYGIVAWGTQENKILIIQKPALRFIFFVTIIPLQYLIISLAFRSKGLKAWELYTSIKYVIYLLAKLIFEIFIHTEQRARLKLVKSMPFLRSPGLAKQTGKSFKIWCKNLIKSCFCVVVLLVQFSAFFIGQRTRTADSVVFFLVVEQPKHQHLLKWRL